MPLVSVVIPIYNVEQYLVRCLDSVINQTYKNLEIICVNDCSPDNSSEILEKYSKMDNRIKIINRKENGGLSAARNSGLEVAGGEYVYFLDSDDWIDLDYIEKMVEAAISSLAEIVINTSVYTHKSLEIKKLKQGDLRITEPQFIDAKNAVYNINWGTWVHLFKKSFLDKNNLNFPEGYIFEDMFFVPQALLKSNKIFALNGPYYHYLLRDNGICRGQNELNCKKNLLKIYNKLYDWLNSENLLEKISIRIFAEYTLEPDNILDNEYYRLLKIYFSKIEKYIEKNNFLYNKIDCLFMHDVLHDIEKAKNTNYKKMYMFSKLRNNIVR